MAPKSKDEPYDEVQNQHHIFDRPAPPSRTVQSSKWKMATSQVAGFQHGSTRYIIDMRWLKSFLDYIGEDDNSCNNVDTAHSFNRVYPPGAINNRKLLQAETIEYIWSNNEESFLNQISSSNSEDCVLRKNLVEGKDFDILSGEQWKLLHEWYGGGPTIERKIINNGRCRVELYPLQLWLRKESDPLRKIPFLVSKADLMAPHGLRNKVLKKLKAHCGINTHIPQNTEIGLVINGIERDESSISDLEDFSCVVVKDVSSGNACDNNNENENNEGSDNEMTLDKETRLASFDFNYIAGNQHGNDCVVAPGCGLVGLSNLGNTCFMNSALQCLSNTEALTCYFLNGTWESDLNADNPLGMKGMLAENYNSLLRNLWCNAAAYSVNPRELKRVIAHFAPQFSGFSQHDAQELLAFLLDGLHEDLNRIPTKPFVEIPSGNGTDDEAIAQLAWQRHKMRNDSFILDLFTGQYRSELVCPVTGKKSVTFDPYNCVTLQLPQSQEGRVRCILHRCPAGTRTTKCTIELPRTATYLDVRRRLSSVTGIDVDCLVLAEVFDFDFFNFYRDSSRVWTNPTSAKCTIELHAYETPVPSPMPFEPVESRSGLGYRNSACTLSVAQNRSHLAYDEMTDAAGAGCALFKLLFRKRAAASSYYYRDMEAFGTPLIIAVPKNSRGEINYQALEQEICMAVARSCRRRSPALSSSTTSSGKCSSSSTLEEGLDIRRHDALADDLDCDISARSTRFCRRADNLAVRAGRNGDLEFADCEWEEWRGLFALRRIEDSHYYEGITLLDNGKPLLIQPLATIGADWTPAGYQRLVSTRAGVVEDVCSDEEDLDEDTASGEFSLERLLHLFAVPEELSEEDAWYSPFAGRHVRARKTMGLWSVPSHLVIHLKRFAASAAGTIPVREKLDTLVRFPLRGLDMAPFVRGPGLASDSSSGSRILQQRAATMSGAASRSVSQGSAGELIFDLYAVVNHYGGSGFGHYTACCLSPGDGKWHLYDDSSVTVISDPARDVVTSAAYVLFYRLRDGGAPRH